MDRAIPSFNRIIVEKMQQKNMQTHYQKLFNIHHSKRVKTETSSCFAKHNPKKQQLQEERNTQIDKNNVILFQKMSRIMHRADPLNQATTHLKINSRRFAIHAQRVNQQNQQFLGRLCKMKPTIDNKKMVEERKKQLAILRMMGRSTSQMCEREKSSSVNLSKRVQTSQREDYDPKESKQSRIKTNDDNSDCVRKFSSSFMLPLNPRPRYRQNDIEIDKELRQSQRYFQREMLKLEERRRNIQSSISQYEESYKNESKRSQSSEHKKGEQSMFETKSIVLFATFKKMEGSIFKIEIHRRHRLYEVVCIQVDCERKLVLSLDEASGNQLLSSIDYDYQRVIDSLQIANGRLLINRQKLELCIDPQQAMPATLKRLKNHSLKYPSHITEQSNEQDHSVSLQSSKGLHGSP